MITNKQPKRTIRSDATLLNIIEYLQAEGKATVTEVAKELEIAKSTAHRHLATLEYRGYIYKEKNEYRLGMLFVGLGQHSKDQLWFSDVIENSIKRIANETGERTQFMAEEHGRGFFLFREQNSNAVQVGANIGDPQYLHASSCGKAILAEMPDEQIKSIVDHWGFPTQTDQTVRSCDELMEEIKTIRERNYALNLEESRQRLFGIGTSITTNTGIIGSISITGPINRFENQKDDILDHLLGTANKIEINLSSSDP